MLDRMGSVGETRYSPFFKRGDFKNNKNSIVMIKTYGAKGLMEWVALIQVGRATIQVPFTGGTKSGLDMSPATYTCRSEVFQQVIENSDYFKSGKIVLLRQTATPEDEKKEAATKAKKTDEPQKPTQTTDTEESATQLEKVTVSDRGEAKAYLMEHFNLSAGTLRTKADIERYGKAHGVEFVGLE